VRRDFGGMRLVERIGAPFGGDAAAGEAGIARDGVNPGGDGRIAAKIGQRFPDFEEDLLGGVFGGGFVGEQGTGQAEHLVAIFVEQALERLVAAHAVHYLWF
jgi:hypothetical protein